jgi:hypothetical protein
VHPTTSDADHVGGQRGDRRFLSCLGHGP